MFHVTCPDSWLAQVVTRREQLGMRRKKGKNKKGDDHDDEGVKATSKQTNKGDAKAASKTKKNEEGIKKDGGRHAKPRVQRILRLRKVPRKMVVPIAFQRKHSQRARQRRRCPLRKRRKLPQRHPQRYPQRRGLDVPGVASQPPLPVLLSMRAMMLQLMLHLRRSSPSPNVGDGR